MSTATGRCLCGDLQFETELPSKWVAHCHCTMCQRSGGSAFVTWVALKEPSQESSITSRWLVLSATSRATQRRSSAGTAPPS